MKYYVADFESTVYEGQESTEVWAAALVALDAPDEQSSVKITSCIDLFMYEVLKEAERVRNHLCIYFHNLAFDGSFIMDWLLHNKGFTMDTFKEYNEQGEVITQKFDPEGTFKMANNTYRYTISDMGEWYSIRLRHRGYFIEFRDSMKLLPFSVEDIGKSFDTKHKKLTMEYVGYRQPCGLITSEEKAYIANDVLVVKEALQAMFNEGHSNMTIGSCCMKEYKQIYKSEYPDIKWDDMFPNIYKTEEGAFIQKSYKGGWCYVNPKYEGQIIEHKGITADVNSLYPYVMSSSSGNRYPVGLGTYFRGEIPEEALADDKYYFVHVKTRFKIKDGKLPTIQIKGSPNYPHREWLLSSDVVDMRLPKEERYKYENRWNEYRDENGDVVKAVVDLYLTMTDWELIQEHYELSDTEIIDGYYYNTQIGLFDTYIDKYIYMKQNSTGPKRQIAKLFANNLYGQFAKRPDDPYMICFLNKDKELRMYPVDSHNRKPGYIPIGSAITSYARAYTIKAAQANYDVFCYSDTDSIHCACSADELKGAPEDPKKLGFWKYEAEWDTAKFLRPKTYIENVVRENRNDVEPYWNVKCAGMNQHVKDLFVASLTGQKMDGLDEYEQAFVSEKRTLDDFKVGLTIPGMLKARRIKGGTLLVKGIYTMQPTLDF